MATFDDKLRQFAIELFKIDAIKFGEFKTKVGLLTPVYCDLRVIVSYPKLMDTLADLIVEYKNAHLNQVDIVCGVPYTALPIATVVAVKSNIPMVMRRKEAKDYGTKKLIEGKFNAGDRCLIIEDVVTSGSSILETVKDLKDADIQCFDAIVLLNREQGGEIFLKQHGIKMHALLKLSQLMEYLQKANCIDQKTVDKVTAYLAETQVDKKIMEKAQVNRLKLSYLERLEYAKNSVAKEIFQIMHNKETNLCVAADLTKTTDILNLAELVGPHICLLKTHIDIVEDFHPNFLKHLQDIAKRHNFLLFEDRKFCDIGKTVQYQYTDGLYQISSWAPIVTVHSLFGNGTLDAIKISEGLKNRSVFLLAEASASGCLIDQKYAQESVNLAKKYPDLIAGIVCQSPLFLDQPGFIQLTPGVQLDVEKDNLGQSYNSPQEVVGNRGADVAVVGRGITAAQDPGSMAAKYRNVLWESYKKRLL